MQGGGGGGGRNGGGCSGGGGIRKGPWMAEEDEVLMEYVRKYGPRDWSSIRSKGLLPRTGKSCRLRWVNKLKPDLKTGCKFSPEEERIVIELQARFGNKWARIATYLPGRTDNDVKNFWSTRQKRLARLLQTPLPPKSQKNQGKMPVSHEVPSLKGPSLDNIPFFEDSSNGQCSQTSYMDNYSDATKIEQMPETLDQSLFNLDAATLPLLEPTIDRQPYTSDSQLLQQLHLNPLALPLLDLPLLPEGTDLIPGIADMSFTDEFTRPDASQCMQFTDELPFFGLETGQPHSVKEENGSLETPDSFFDDFPTDMFDNLEPPPASTTSSTW